MGMLLRFQVNGKPELVRRTLLAQTMRVPDVTKVPDAALREKQADTESMDGGVAEALVVESTSSVKMFKVRSMLLTAEESKRSDLEVGVKLAVVVLKTVEDFVVVIVFLVWLGRTYNAISLQRVLEQPFIVGILVDQILVALDKSLGPVPQRWERSGIVENGHVESVRHVIVAHEAENIVIDVATEIDL